MDDSAPSAGEWIVLYGSLMRGLGAMDSLGIGDQIRYVSPCICPGELFDLGDYPGLRPGKAQVVAELHAVLDRQAISTLDAFEDFDPAKPRDSLYLREELELIEPRGTRAWVYVYNRVPDAAQRVASGDWRAHLSAR